MKKVIMFLLCVVLLATAGAPAWSVSDQTTTNIEVNLYYPDKDYTYSANLESDGLPIISAGVVLAPLRSLAAHLQLSLYFGNGVIREVIITDGIREMRFGEDPAVVSVSGSTETVELPHETRNIAGRIYAPAAFVAEYFGFYVAETAGARHFNPYRNGEPSDGIVISNFTVLNHDDLHFVRGGKTLNLFDDSVQLQPGDLLVSGIAIGDPVEKVTAAYGKELFIKETHGEKELCYATSFSYQSLAQIRLCFFFDTTEKLVKVTMRTL